MKQDISPLGLIPALILGMLGYTSGVGILQNLSQFLGQPLQTGSIQALTYIQYSIGILFCLCPFFVLGISLLAYGWDRRIPILFYIVQLLVLLFSTIGGWILEFLYMRAKQDQIEALMPGEQWIFFVEDFHPLISGAMGLVCCAALIYAISRARRKID